MAGFIRAGTLVHHSAQSGSIWSGLLCPQRSLRAPVDLTELGWVRSGHFLCVLGILGIWLISAQRAAGPAAHTGSLHCQREDYIKIASSRDSHHAASHSHIPLSLHTVTHTHRHTHLIHFNDTFALAQQRLQQKDAG